MDIHPGLCPRHKRDGDSLVRRELLVLVRRKELSVGSFEETGASRALILFSLALCVAAGLVFALVHLGILHGVAKLN